MPFLNSRPLVDLHFLESLPPSPWIGNRTMSQNNLDIFLWPEVPMPRRALGHSWAPHFIVMCNKPNGPNGWNNWREVS